MLIGRSTRGTLRVTKRLLNLYTYGFDEDNASVEHKNEWLPRIAQDPQYILVPPTLRYRG